MTTNNQMPLGAFSISLAVKDIKKSKQFYEKLGFQVVGGEITQNWLIMRNDSNTIGLFQGMFKHNVMTFNPGWDSQCNEINEFVDIRKIHENLVSSGVEITESNLDNDTGPAHISIVDPDGNAILIDQHR